MATPSLYVGEPANASVAKGVHLVLKVRTVVTNGTFDLDHAVAERWAKRPFRRIA